MPSVVLGDFAEPDLVEGALHPRATAQVFGHAEAEAQFLHAYTAGRLHHAWMIVGPKGVGKATLAYHLARFLLFTPQDDGGMFAPEVPSSLHVAMTASEAAQVLALSHPRLYLLRKGLTGESSAQRPATRISVDEVRKMTDFFHLSASEGGRRVAIIDDIDQMTPQAANAFLKLLEEPPANVVFLLISHQPARLLPTIRSRCRPLRLGPLNVADMALALAAAGGAVAQGDAAALAELAGGSAGRAFELTNLDGLALYQSLVDLLGGLPRIDRPRAQAIADATAGKAGEAQFDLTIALIDLFLARLSRAAALGGLAPDAAKGEGALISRLGSGQNSARHWAALAQQLGIKARQGKAVNLDPAALVLDMLLAIEAGARDLSRA